MIEVNNSVFLCYAETTIVICTRAIPKKIDNQLKINRVLVQAFYQKIKYAQGIKWLFIPLSTEAQVEAHLQLYLCFLI